MLTDELTPTNVGDFVGQFFVFKFDQQLSLRNSFAIGDLNVPDKARSLSSDNGQVPVINNHPARLPPPATEPETGTLPKQQ